MVLESLEVLNYVLILHTCTISLKTRMPYLYAMTNNLSNKEERRGFIILGVPIWECVKTLTPSSFSVFGFERKKGSGASSVFFRFLGSEKDGRRWKGTHMCCLLLSVPLQNGGCFSLLCISCPPERYFLNFAAPPIILGTLTFIRAKKRRKFFGAAFFRKKEN